MAIPEQERLESPQEKQGPSPAEPESSGDELRIEIRAVAPNWENLNTIAEIFPCK